MLDIKGNAFDLCCVRLSNFTERRFLFDGIACASIEGPLQAFKYPVVAEQTEICALVGKDAKREGSKYNCWKDSHILWWKNSPYQRVSREYFLLVTRLYDAVYEQDKRFKEDILAIGYEEIRHSIGETNMYDTVLTEVEMLYQLNRLRIRALQER
jgi:hypothetical protein